MAETNDDFFAPQTPEEQAIVDAGFAAEKPPVDGKPPEVPPTEPPAVVPPIEDKASKPEVPAPQADAPKPPLDDKVPRRADAEPEWKFNLRIKLWEQGKKLREAKTPEEKELARKNVTDVRRELAKQSQEHQQQPPSDDDSLSDYTDPNLLDADTKRVSALGKRAGLATTKDVQDAARAVIREEREIGTRNKALDDFFAEHKDSYVTPENRDVFFETVEQYFNYEGKDYDGFRFIFDSAHGMLFPDNLEDTIAKADALKEKIKPVQFSGGNAANATPKDAEKERIKKQYADQGENVDWLLD